MPGGLFRRHAATATANSTANSTTTNNTNNNNTNNTNASNRSVHSDDSCSDGPDRWFDTDFLRVEDSLSVGTGQVIAITSS